MFNHVFELGQDLSKIENSRVFYCAVFLRSLSHGLIFGVLIKIKVRFHTKISVPRLCQTDLCGVSYEFLNVDCPLATRTCVRLS